MLNDFGNTIEEPIWFGHIERSDEYDTNTLSDFYKNNQNDKIYWVDRLDRVGEYLFSFDKKKLYNLFSDYPNNLTAQEKELFDKENPYFARLLQQN